MNLKRNNKFKMLGLFGMSMLLAACGIKGKPLPPEEPIMLLEREKSVELQNEKNPQKKKQKINQ